MDEVKPKTRRRGSTWQAAVEPHEAPHRPWLPTAPPGTSCQAALQALLQEPGQRNSRRLPAPPRHLESPVRIPRQRQGEGLVAAAASLLAGELHRLKAATAPLQARAWLHPFLTAHPFPWCRPVITCHHRGDQLLLLRGSFLSRCPPGTLAQKGPAGQVPKRKVQMVPPPGLPGSLADTPAHQLRDEVSCDGRSESGMLIRTCGPSK